jgi:hypothetical protein
LTRKEKDALDKTVFGIFSRESALSTFIIGRFDGVLVRFNDGYNPAEDIPRYQRSNNRENMLIRRRCLW